MADFKSSAREFLSFVDSSPSPFHAVNAAREILAGNGFKRISEADEWAFKPNDKFYFTRNQSTIVAVAIGGQYKAGNGFSMIGAHTDSPCLRVKPNSKMSQDGYLQVGVECYGGGLWNTWFDRDLGVAGRVMVMDDKDQITHRLVCINKPIMRIPNLAIHLNREIYKDGFKFNKETHLRPIIASEAEALLNQPEAQESSDPDPLSQAPRHHSVLINLLADELGVKPEAICDFELSLFDTQGSVIGGALEEFIYAPRLDNLNSSFCALKGLVESMDSLEEDENIRMVCLFDHEEVGSKSAQGAGSSLFEYVLQRLSGGSVELFGQALKKSYVVSADMAHAIHPCYSGKHESNHKPKINQGVVIKFNSNQRYATNAATTAIFRVIAKKAGVPLQDVMVRNDSACGSTIGPIIASGLAIPTIDIGNPQLSMHSIREMGGVKDVHYAITLFKAFFKEFVSVNKTVHVD